MRSICPMMLVLPVLAGLVLITAPVGPIEWGGHGAPEMRGGHGAPGVPGGHGVPGTPGSQGVPGTPGSPQRVVRDARPASAPTSWVWPTGSSVVQRPWEAPVGEYGPGHRGLDVAAAIGTEAVAVADGSVAFAGQVAGRGVVTIDHGGGLVSTLDSVAPLVRVGDVVEQGAAVGTVTVGHCAASAPCVHLGARRDDRYLDPLTFLPQAAWPVLLPEHVWPG